MKKAKRLLAVLLAALMIVSAAFLPAYAKMLPGNAYVVPGVANNQKYYFTADQGAGWLLDTLDSLLADANITFDLGDMISEGLLDFIANDWFGRRTDYKLSDIDYTLDLRSIDSAIRSIYILLDCVLASDLIGMLGGLFGDILNDEYGIDNAGLNLSIKRGKREDNYAGASNDMDVLFMILDWLNTLRPAVKRIVAGEFSLGSILEDMVLPDNILTIVKDLDGFLKLTLYQMLVDENAEALPTDTATPIDDGVQKLINWALVTGTSPEAGGMTSLLGEYHEPLMPAIGDQPGGANIKGVTIQVDRDGDGVLENKTMSFYQLVSNALNGLLNGMLAPMLGELIADLVGVEITEQYPEGDPEILSDMMFNTILGAVESLAEQNGAPDLVYTEEQNATPMGKINALMDWFFNQGGLDTFIKIDFWGIGFTDNFMSLLNDLGRLAINLLPGLVGGDMFEGAEKLAYSAEDLNLIHYYKPNASGQYVICDETDEAALGQTYLTYEKGEVVYATEWDPDTEAPTAYKYMSNHQAVDIDEANAGSSTYRNASLIRPNYVITRDQVFACLIKMLLNGFIDGCYWPEWTDNIPAVLAYAMAALAAPALPEGNYFARLDAYHQTGGVAPIADANGGSIEPIPYYTIKNGIEIPTAALNIGASVAAFYLNAVFTFEDAERLTEVGTTFEQFVAEFLIWAADEYLPMLVGEFNTSTGTFTGTGIWTTAFNNLISAIYSDYSMRTLKANPNWDAIYTFLDVTLLKLIPASWLPEEINSSFDLFDGWLLNNLLHFDLQGILGLFSTNKDETGELHQPALTVIIRILDRVLGLVFNGTPMFLPVDSSRTGIGANGVANIFVNHTSITSLDALLTANGANSSLPTFVDQLLGSIISLRSELLTTVLPIVMGGVYEKPYDKEIGASGDEYDDDWLTANGRDLSTFKAADLQWYIDMFTEHTNAVKGAVRYETYEEAEAAITDEENQYVSGQSFYVKEYDDEGNEVYDGYYIYTNNDYYLTATENYIPQTKNGEDNSYSEFNTFTFSRLVPRTKDRPYVMYEDYDVSTDQERFANVFRAYSVEDFKQDPYAYHNLKQALKKANEALSAYDSFSTDLGNAYGEWQRYFIQTRLYQLDLVDSNNDGKFVNSTSDPDYVAPTEDGDGNITNPGVPVDDPPTIPSVILPFDIGTNTAYAGAKFTYYDQSRDDYFTVTPDTFTTANNAFRQYDQIAKAYDHGLDVNRNVVLSDAEAEEVVQVAIRSLVFDLSKDSNGNYDPTKMQWSDLTTIQLQDVAALCAELHYQFTYDVEAGIYQISRPAFRFIDSSYVVFGTSNKVINADACPPLALSDGSSSDEATRIDDAMFTAYVDYLTTVVNNRKSIYNAIELLTDRAEEAAERRMTKIDSQMLKWALNLPEIKNAYENGESGIRNRKITGVKDDGTYYYSKVYTQTSYDKFRKAYDYAKSLDLAEQGLIQAKGLTQSMVTFAFQNLLAMFNQLIIYTGDADFTQLLEYLTIAEGMINNPNKNHDELGYEENSLANLESVYATVQPVSVDKTIDCEGQQIVDAAAAELLTAINNIIYKSVPKIIPTLEGGAKTEITSAPGAGRTQGHIFGLKEGEGVTLDLIEVIGMRIDAGAGNRVTVEDSGKGTGTGAYLRGTVGNLEKFRFYAVLYGDLNGDTRIDGTDRTTIDLYIIQGINNNAEPDQGGMGAIRHEAGDVDRSGNVDATDSALIELHYNYEDAEGNDFEIPQDEHSPVAVVA